MHDHAQIPVRVCITALRYRVDEVHACMHACIHTHICMYMYNACIHTHICM